MLKWVFLAAVGVFVCWHFWPKATAHVGTKIVDTTVAASKAGYEAASK